MKVTAIQSKPEFQPVTLTIEITDPIMLEAIHTVAFYDRSIPSTLVANEFILSAQGNAFSAFLKEVNKALSSL